MGALTLKCVYVLCDCIYSHRYGTSENSDAAPHYKQHISQDTNVLCLSNGNADANAIVTLHFVHAIMGNEATAELQQGCFLN